MVTLHEELLAILEAQGNDWMSVDDLAAAVNARGRYAKRDGSSVEPGQVHLRTRAGGSYERLFKREGRLVQARAADTPGPSADRDAPLPPPSTAPARTSPTPAAKSGAADAIGPAPFDRAALLAAFADASDALFAAGIIRSDSFTGEIGEYVASQTLGLTLLGRNVAAVDATRDGRGYQIKSVTSDDRSAAIPTPHLVAGWEVLVCVRLSRRYRPIEVIEIDRDDFPPGKRVVSERLLRSIGCRRHTEFPTSVREAQPLLERFGEAYAGLEAGGVIRTRHVVADVGEAYAAEVLGLTLMDDPTHAGYDAIDGAGVTYEIKTRRVYESGRRTSETRRVNGLVGKTANTLVVVRLDHAFACSGMWTMPLRNVVNPKSANMSSVLDTPGIANVR